MVSPLISTPMAMMASKGAVDAADVPPGWGVEERREVRSEELELSRSPAPRLDAVVDWIWEAE
jgi:hypothetical protein